MMPILGIREPGRTTMIGFGDYDDEYKNDVFDDLRSLYHDAKRVLEELKEVVASVKGINVSPPVMTIDDNTVNGILEDVRSEVKNRICCGQIDNPNKIPMPNGSDLTAATAALSAKVLAENPPNPLVQLLSEHAQLDTLYPDELTEVLPLEEKRKLKKLKSKAKKIENKPKKKDKKRKKR
jgi:hypothetical protein